MLCDDTVGTVDYLRGDRCVSVLLATDCLLWYTCTGGCAMELEPLALEPPTLTTLNIFTTLNILTTAIICTTLATHHLLTTLKVLTKKILHTGNTRPSCTCVIQEYRFYTISLSKYHGWCQYHKSTSIGSKKVLKKVKKCQYGQKWSKPFKKGQKR